LSESNQGEKVLFRLIFVETKNNMLNNFLASFDHFCCLILCWLMGL